MALPKKIKVGTQAWTVIERSRSDDASLASSYGYTIEKTNIIVLDRDCPTSRKRQTLFHELFHAVRFSSGNTRLKPSIEDVPSDDIIEIWEHYFIGMYEDGMLAVLRDNPTLANYLLEKDV
jgi:hypothetical protein